MKHLRKLLSVLLAAAVLIPSAVPVASAHNQEGTTQAMHPFSSTEQLIQDAVQELHDRGEIAEVPVFDAALIKDVEQKSDKTYNEVKTAVVERLQENLGAGEIDVSDLNLPKNTLQKVMAEVLEENYLDHAITGMTYAAKGGAVSKVDFDVSEGYQSAMDSLEEEDSSEMKPEMGLMEKLASKYSKYFKAPQSQGRRSAARYSMRAASNEASAAPACQRHIVTDHPLLGDVTRDGVLNVKDIAAIRDVMAKNETAEAKAVPPEADVNKDSTIDDKDIAALREIIVNEEKTESLTIRDLKFTWGLQQDFTPRDQNGAPLDVMNHPEDADKIANGGLLYAPDPNKGGEMAIQQGILPDIYWGLEEVSFTCAKCGHKVVYKRDAANPQNPINQALDQMITRYNVYVDVTQFNPQTGEGTTLVPITAEQPQVTDTFILSTQISMATFVDDSFDGTTVGPDGQLVGLYMDSNQGNNDNFVAQINFYYNMFSKFNADHADYLGVSTRYWTSKNSEADPLAAIKSLCNIPLDIPIPPANMVQLIQMLPQAFMSYVMFYGDQLMAMKEAARDVVAALPYKTTRVQKLLVLHDWVAENTTFDMGAMMTVNESEGNPETDPIQMTAFGALLSRQLAANPDQNGKIYGGCICLGYVAAYNLLLQDIVYADTYKNDDGSWKTPDEIGDKDQVDCGQVMFYSNTSDSSIAGEGFGGGFFNNVHYYNLVQVPEAPTTGGDKDNPRTGNWFFVDVCYDDIFVECMSQYRAETDGSVHHDYFLASPLTMNKIWGGSIDFISNLHDGVEFKTKVDENGNPVPYPKDHRLYNPAKPDHPMHVTVPAPNETGSNNTCYEDTWFSGAVSKIYHDKKNWYYVDSETSTLGFSDKAEEDEDGNYQFNFDDMTKHDIKAGIHATRASSKKQPKLDCRPMQHGDYWTEKKEDNKPIFGNKQQDMEFKDDPYDTTLLDYGTGKGQDIDIDEYLIQSVKEHYTYTDQYPGITPCLGLYQNKLYFNLGNKIFAYDLNTQGCKPVKAYNEVKASTDGRVFTASSYYLDPNGKDLVVQDNPLAGLVIRDNYVPQFQEVQGHQVFTGMKKNTVMSVNVATNYSFTAGFSELASNEENMETLYQYQAVNYNGDFNQVLNNNMEETRRDPNTNQEFLWCANIRDEIDMASFKADPNAGKDTSCAGKETGHDYVYDTDERVYVCKNCNLHARNIITEDPNFDITLHHNPPSGQQQNSLFGQGSSDETIIPVNDSREAAVLTHGTMKDGKLIHGRILVEVTPKHGDITKMVTGVTYTPRQKGGQPTLVTEKNEDGMFIIDKPDLPELACMKIGVVTEDAYNISASVMPSNMGRVTVKQPTAQARDEAHVTITPNVGYGIKNIEIKGRTSNEIIDLYQCEKASDGTYDLSFNMPAEHVNVVVTMDRYYNVNIKDSTYLTTSNGNSQAFAGETVKVTAVPGYELDSVQVKNDTTGKLIGMNSDNSFVMPKANVSISGTAHMKLNNRNVTISNGTVKGPEGTISSTGAFKPGDTLTATAVPPTKMGFVRWEAKGITLTEEQAKSPSFTFTMPNQDISLTAVCVEEFTVTYTDGVDNGDLFPDQVHKVLKGSPTPAFEGGTDGKPTMEGWIFTGWKPEVSPTVTANATYIAQWTEAPSVNPDTVVPDTP